MNTKLLTYFPFLRTLLASIARKFLDLTDYPFTRGAVNKLQREYDLLLSYFHLSDLIDSYHVDLISVLIPTNLPKLKMRRMGAKHDGGYVLPETSLIEFPWVTIGLGYNCEFENHVFQESSLVYTFDHTIPNRPKSLNRKITWQKRGWGSNQNHKKLASLESLLDSTSLTSSSTWNLKFDIEGGEWDLFDEIFLLGLRYEKPAIIVCELHEVLWPGRGGVVMAKVASLCKQYYPLVVHGNNFSAKWTSSHYSITDALEVTLVRKDLLSSLEQVESQESLHSPNNPKAPEIEVFCNH